MSARPLLVVLALATSVALAGCLGPPASDPDRPSGEESFTVAAEGTATDAVYVAVHLYATPPESVTLEYANGSTRAVAVPTDGELVQGDASAAIRALDLPESDRGIVFEGAPSFTATAEEIQPMQTAIYVVRVDGGDRVTAWGVVNCDWHVDHLTLDVDGETVSAGAFGCSN